MPRYEQVYASLDRPPYQSPVPEGISPLHYLYPGRLMQTNFSPDRSNIINEAGEVASDEWQKILYEQNKKNAVQLENMAREQGGGDKNKIIVHPPVEPEAMIEDTQLRGVTMPYPPGENMTDVPPPIRNFEGRENFRAGEEKVKSRGREEKEEKTDANGAILMFIAIVLILMLVSILMTR